MQLIDSGSQKGVDLMTKDRTLLNEIDRVPILHFYDWAEPTATYGLLTKPEAHLSQKALQQDGIHLAQRPTGGGILFHLYDLAFSLVLPKTHPLVCENTLANYRWINQIVAEAVTPFVPLPLTLLPQTTSNNRSSLERFCMAKPTPYDVLCDNKKLIGAAQRKTKKGLLHQGTISLCLPNFSLLQEFLPANSSVIEAMQQHTFYLTDTENDLSPLRNQIKKMIYNNFYKHLDGKLAV